MAHIDFSTKTKEIIAALNGHKCSFPYCNCSATYPNSALEETSIGGFAVHIYPVSFDGAQKAGGITEDEFISPENGIWLCASHARHIEANPGNKFPPVLLHGYKALHEAKIAHENQGIKSPFGWFYAIRIEKSPIFSSNQIAHLGKLTFIIGDNATGKSALCEWLTGFSEFKYMGRWRKNDGVVRHPIRILLKYYNPEEKILEMDVSEVGHVNYLDNETDIPLNANPMKIIYPRSRSSLDASNFNDLQLISLLLDFDENIVINLCAEIRRYEYSMVKDIEFKKNNDGGLYLCLDMGGNSSGLSFNSLSIEQQECVLIEFAAAAARIYAKYLPTLLILDGIANNLNEAWFKLHASYFINQTSLFQTILVIPNGKVDLNKLKWAGWVIIHTKGSLPEVAIVQEGIR